MPSRFGEKITDQDAYATASSAAKHMSTEQLQQAVSDDSHGPNQRQAASDEIARRSN